MNGSFRIATIAGSEVRIHFSFLLLLGLFAGGAWFQAGPTAGLTMLMLMGLLFLCVLLHEFGHALAGRYFGINTPEIVLLPIGGVAQMERIPSSPFQELVITVAGPAVNVAIALGCFLVLGIHGFFASMTSLTGLPGDGILAALLAINLRLIVFNVIPAFPMDGGRILRALLATQLSHATATLIAARIGQGIAGLFILSGMVAWPESTNPFLNFFGLSGGQNFILAFIGLFVLIGAQQELVYTRIREAVASHSLEEVMTTQFTTLGDTMRLGDLPDFLMDNNQQVFPVVGEDLAFRGLADREDLVKAAQKLPPESAIKEAARTVQAVTLSSSSTEVLDLMQKLSEPVLPVVNSSGQIIGLVEFSRMVQAPLKSNEERL